MDRRQFMKGAASAIVLGPTLLQMGACGDDESAAADGGGNAGTQGSTSGTGAGSGAGNGTAGTSAAGNSAAGTGSTDKDGSVLADGAVGDDSGLTPSDGGGALDGGPADSGTDAALSVCPSGASATSITSNHGHSLSISKEDAQAGAQKTYSIEGVAGHPHNVIVTSAHFATLATGGSVTITSDGGHTHDVTIECV